MTTATVELSRAAAVKIVREAYAELSYLNLQDGFREVHTYLLDKNLAAEREHRRFRPDHVSSNLGIKDAAKLFVVEHLLDGWKEPDKWTVDSILSIRNEVLYAQAYAKRFHQDLAAWAEKWAEPFKGVDYAKLMQ